MKKDLYRLQNLKIIELTANKITTIPSSIGKMQFLERLCLGKILIDTSEPISALESARKVGR